MSGYQPRFTRLTAQYVRRELLKLLRRKYLPLMARHVQCQPTDPGAWSPFKTIIDVSFLRMGIEALAAMPSVRREPKPRGVLAEYERQLKAWKRRRSIARNKVARYARLVRYHRKTSADTGVPGQVVRGGGRRTPERTRQNTKGRA